jgi:hypothetical protein
VWNKKIITRFPSQDEVTSARYGWAGTVVITDLVDDTPGKVGHSAYATATDTIQRRVESFLRQFPSLEPSSFFQHYL